MNWLKSNFIKKNVKVDNIFLYWIIEMYINLIEQQPNIYNKSYTANIPNLEFESYIPDDFFYAPDEGLSFKYMITSPLNGDYIDDINYGGTVIDYMAYSIEKDGKYYWTYNVYEVPNSETPPENMSLMNKWLPAMWYWQLPQSYQSGGEWDFWIDSALRNPNNGSLDISIGYKTNYPIYAIVGNTSNIYNVHPLFITPDIYAEISGDYIKSNMFLFKDSTNFQLFYKMKFSGGSIYLEEIFDYDGQNKIDINIPWSVYEGNKVNLAIKISKDNRIYNIEGEDNIVWPNDEITYQLSIPGVYDVEYDVYFDKDEVVKIEIPYSYSDGEYVGNETYSFQQLFDSKYKYPTTTRDLLKVDYEGMGTNIIPSYLTSPKAKVKINNYPEFEVNLKTRLESDSLIIYSDQEMFYDYDNESIVLGISSGKYENENGIVLPWDQISSGTITFTFETESLSTNTFNIKLNIGNTNKLRGVGGKYEVIEK